MSIVQDNLRLEKVVVLLHPPYSPDLARMTFFVPKAQKYLFDRKYVQREHLGSAIFRYFPSTVELQWLEHLWDYENMFEAGVVQANEC